MHMHSGNPMAQHGNMTVNGSPLRSMHQMNNTFGLNSHPMDAPPMHNNRGMIPNNMMSGAGNQMSGMNPMNTMSNMNNINTMNNMNNMNSINNMNNMNNINNMNNLNNMNNMNNISNMNAMNNANTNMSSMNPLGQLAQMNATPNSHMSMNSPNNPRLGSSSPSLSVNSPLGPNGNRVPGKNIEISFIFYFI